MSVASNGKTLTAATRELLARWDETKDSWRDVKSREFEERFLAELAAGIERAGPVFDSLDKVLMKARGDCE